MELKSTRLYEDAKVEEDLPKGPDAPKIIEIMQGLKTWRNLKNKFFVGRLHYSADPKKRSKKWKDEAKAGITYAQFMREYEIVGTSFEGVPVFIEQFSKSHHVSSEPLMWSTEYPVVRGWDFGLDTLGMACIFTQLVSNSRLIALKEIVASDSDIYTFAEAVQRMSLEWFPGAKRYVDIVDPSGFNRDARNKNKDSYASVLKKILHTKPIPGEVSIDKRLKAVVDRLNGSVRGQPKFLMDQSGCPTLVEAFDGGYFYAYTKDGQVHDTPTKNKWSHIMDAAQMVCTRIDNINLFEDEAGNDIPISPRYNFGR